MTRLFTLFQVHLRNSGLYVNIYDSEKVCEGTTSY